MSNNHEAILNYLNQGREDRERTAIEVGDLFEKMQDLRRQLEVVEQEYEEAVEAAKDAGWQQSELMELGIGEDPRTIAARKAARKRRERMTGS